MSYFEIEFFDQFFCHSIKMFLNSFNYLLIFQLIAIVAANDSSTTIVETTIRRHLDLLDTKSHKHLTAELNHPNSQTGCPAHNIFSPCECNEVSFDGINFQNQISCKGLDGKQIQSAFHNAAHETSIHDFNTTYDILEIKESTHLNLCCDDLTKGFKFRTIKITDSNLININENSFESTSQFTKEFVLMDIVLTNNLDNGDQVFNLIKKFENLEGVYVISSNLKELPQNAFISTSNSKFGHNLQIVRICNSLISKLYDLTFAQLSNLVWIDLGDNRINQVTANTFTMLNANSEITLRISLSGNRLTSSNIEEGAFSDVKRSVDIYLNDNKIDTLKETVWYRLINSEKNIYVYLKNNPLTCDCRHHWLQVHKAETELHFKDANCESTGQSIFLKNFALCEKAPLLDPFGDVYKKCCRQIQYKNKPELHETVLITETDHHTNREADRLIEKTSVSRTSHHDDFKQIKEDFQIRQHVNSKQHVDIPVVKHMDISAVKHIDAPVVKHVDTIKHVDTGVKHFDTNVRHVDTANHLHEPEIRETEVISNQRLVSLPPKLHRLLSPAVLVKKPLKYRRLVSTIQSDQIRQPAHHAIMYAESSA